MEELVADPARERPMAEVRLEELTKVYGTGAVAIRDMSLAVRDGELFVLMGPSGCGKTTTLRLIAGLEEPTQGSIRIGGQRVNDWPAHRRNVAMVFQRPALYPHLSVRQNLAFAARLRGVLNGQFMTELMERLQLGHLLERKPWQLSGGEQQRVALGRALVRQPSVLLLDEPLSNLDAQLRIDLRRELHLLQRRLRATMIYVTHDQAEAMTLGDRVAVLEGGILQQIGAPTELYSRPANRRVAAGIGVPGMNLLNGELSGEEGIAGFRRGACVLTLPLDMGQTWSAFRGRPLTLGVRPENVMVAERSNCFALPMAVVLVEPLGDRTLVTLRNEAWTLTASFDVPQRPSFAEGQSILVNMDMAQTHLFDGETGMALRHPDSG
jgi:multiple sugar transport system ATP-binding protein